MWSEPEERKGEETGKHNLPYFTGVAMFSLAFPFVLSISETKRQDHVKQLGTWAFIFTNS